jgi:hypothetical protein
VLVHAEASAAGPLAVILAIPSCSSYTVSGLTAGLGGAATWSAADPSSEVLEAPLAPHLACLDVVADEGVECGQAAGQRQRKQHQATVYPSPKPGWVWQIKLSGVALISS